MINDQNEIAQWVELYTKDLYSYTQSKISNQQAVEDIVQNTFLAALESYRKFERESNPKTWLFAILKNKIADFLRSKYKEANINIALNPLEICFDENGAWEECHRPKNWHIEEQVLDNPEFMQVLRSCLDNLPSKWSSAIQLKYLHEQSSQNICNDLNISMVNYWQMIHRAKVMLRLCVESNWLKVN